YFPRLNRPAEAFMSLDGVLWIAGASKDVRSYRVDPSNGLLEALRKPNDWHMSGTPDGTLARDGEWLYATGSYIWRRINLKTGVDEVLVPDPRSLPNYGSGSPWTIAMSPQFGLVAFSRGQLYRVTVQP